MKTNKEQEKTATVEDLPTFKCEADLQPKIVHGGPTTGYRAVTDFSWARDPNILLDATKDDKNYVPVESETANPYDEACDALYREGVIRRKADLTDIYNDIFHCIVAKLDQEVVKMTKAADNTCELGGDIGNHDYYVGMESEARNIRDYVHKLFNDTSFRYRELYELLGDK